MVIHRTHPLPA